MKPAKKCNRLSKATRNKLIIYTSLGVTLIMLAITSHILDPIYLIAKYKMRFARDTKFYHLLKEEIAGAYVSAYVFNVTNPKEFLSGQDHQLKVQEVGPFTYQEKRINENFELDEELQELRYNPYITASFIPELSIGDPADINVTLPNSVLLATSTSMSTYPFWSQLGLNILTKRYESKALLTKSVQDFLWGYDEPLLALGNTVMPGWINFRKMGFLDRLYDNTRDYRIELSVNDADKFKIKRVNGVSGLACWNYENPSLRTRCNSFEDVYEGFSYPPGLTPETPIRIYRNVFCRILELDYAYTKTVDYGPEAFLYKISNRSYTMNPDKECLCSRLGCVDGLSDLSPCFYGLPLMLSNAHFYGADPKVYERIDGIAPDEEKHGGSFLVEWKLGTALMTSMTFQLNVPVSDVSFNKEAKPFANMTIPIAYFLVTQPELADDVKTAFWIIYVAGPNAMLAIEILLFTIGLSLLVFATRTVFWNLFTNETSIGFQVANTSNKLNCELPLMSNKQQLEHFNS
ncbi:unnamed protein product [Parnassius mnemosyne]|uniref:Scavenger receptor class B member 1 n=1 Tax=Parnassius mnemosyne TaxID=213953 RepID=A0AAV1K7A2_9NEOP